MTLVDVFVAFFMAGCLSFLSFQIGEMQGEVQGKMLGYNTCVAEEDGDAPRTYAGDGSRPAEKL